VHLVGFIVRKFGLRGIVFCDELKCLNMFSASTAHILWFVDLSGCQFYMRGQQDQQTQHHHIRSDGVNMYTAHNTQFSTNNFIHILYFNINFKSFIQIYKCHICKLFDVLCNTSFERTPAEDGHNRWPTHVGGESKLFIIK
jgi:hypothetical protein